MANKPLTLKQRMVHQNVIVVDGELQSAISAIDKAIDALKKSLTFVGGLQDHESMNVQDVVRRLQVDRSYLANIRRWRTAKAGARAREALKGDNQ